MMGTGKGWLLRGLSQRKIVLSLVLVSVVYLGASGFLVRDVGYIYEEVFPHQRVIPRTVEGAGLNSHDQDEGGRLAHQLPGEARGGCHVVQASQWPVFSVVCGPDVYPILSESYQGNWVYYLSYAWQALFGSSLRSLRFLAGLLGVAGIWLLFFVVRRESGAAAGLVAAVLLAGNVLYLCMFSFAHLYETVPCLLALGSFACLQVDLRKGGGDRPGFGELSLSVLLLSAAISLKATVGILLLPFGVLWFRDLRRLSGAKLRLAVLGAIFLIPMIPFIVNESLCVMTESPKSSFFTYLGYRQDQLFDWNRIPMILMSSLKWLFATGASIDFVSGMFFGVEASPWLRADLMLLFGGSMVWAAVRWLKGGAGLLGKAALLCIAAAFVQSVLLYATDSALQAFIYIVPFLVGLTALFLVSFARWAAERLGMANAGPRFVVGLTLLYAIQIAEPLARSLAPQHLLCSAAEQDSLCKAVEASVSRFGGEVVTTRHNHIGLLEHCTSGRIRPANAYFALAPGVAGEELHAELQSAAGRLFDRWPGALYLVDIVPADAGEKSAGTVREGQEELTTVRLEAFAAAAERKNMDFRLLFVAGDEDGIATVGGFQLRPRRSRLY